MLVAVIVVINLQVSRALDAVQADGAAAQDALTLALTVREHYLHEAHTVIAGDEAQVGHHHHWIHHVQEQAEALGPRVPPVERDGLKLLVHTAGEIDALFREELVPASLEGDVDRVREIHEQSEALIQKASRQADAIVTGINERATATRARADRLSRLATVVGAGGLALLVALAIFLSLRLRAAVLAPLERLGEAAHRFGAGELDHRVGDLGLDELGRLGQALDAMAGELADREEQLVRAERGAAIGQLTAGIAHEINNPIGVIRGYLKTMLPEASEPELREELQILDDEAAACQRIVEDLLTYARAPGLERVEVDLERLALDLTRRVSSARPNAMLELDLQPGALWADELRVVQVLGNLALNAIHVGPEGAAVRIEGAPSPDGSYVLRVLDRGPGIPEGERDRIFEPFFSRRQGGSGLGLAVCRGIVQAHRGEIVVEDRPGGGTVFEVRLPAREEVEDDV